MTLHEAFLSQDHEFTKDKGENFLLLKMTLVVYFLNVNIHLLFAPTEI